MPGSVKTNEGLSTSVLLTPTWFPESVFSKDVLFKCVTHLCKLVLLFWTPWDLCRGGWLTVSIQVHALVCALPSPGSCGHWRCQLPPKKWARLLQETTFSTVTRLVHPRASPAFSYRQRKLPTVFKVVLDYLSLFTNYFVFVGVFSFGTAPWFYLTSEGVCDPRKNYCPPTFPGSPRLAPAVILWWCSQYRSELSQLQVVPDPLWISLNFHPALMVAGSVVWFQETQAGGAVSDTPVGISSALWVLEPTLLTLPCPLLAPQAWLRASGSQTHSVTASLAYLPVSLTLSVCLCWLLMPASLLNLDGPSLAACSPCLLTHFPFIFRVGAKISIKKKIWSYTTLWLKAFQWLFCHLQIPVPTSQQGSACSGLFPPL